MEDKTNWDFKVDGNREHEDVPSSVAIDNNGDIIVAVYSTDLINKTPENLKNF